MLEAWRCLIMRFVGWEELSAISIARAFVNPITGRRWVNSHKALRGYVRGFLLRLPSMIFGGAW